MKPLKKRRCIAVDNTGRRCGNHTRARHSNLCREHRGSFVLALMDLFNPKPFRRTR